LEKSNDIKKKFIIKVKGESHPSIQGGVNPINPNERERNTQKVFVANDQRQGAIHSPILAS
jgi:hypothetical protein